MRKGFLGSLTAVLASAGLAMAQTPAVLPQTLPEQQPAVVAPGQVALAPAPAADPKKAGAGDKGLVAEPMAAPKSTAPTEQPQQEQGPIVEEQMPMLKGQFYASTDYLFWSTKSQHLPPLVTTGPNPTLTGSAAAATLGVNGTGTTIFGEQRVEGAQRSGWRTTAGYWLDKYQSLGVEASAFYLAPRGTSFFDSSNGSTLLGRPFLSPTLNASPLLAETAFLVASSTQTGSISVSGRNEFWGTDANIRCNVRGGSWYRADALLGVRYLRLKDTLDINSTSTALPGNFIAVPGQAVVTSNLAVSDHFLTTNDFYGGQVGAHIELKKYGWFADFTGKIAAGVVHQSVDISGSTLAANTIGPAGGTTGAVLFPGGLLAQPRQNIGNHSRNQFGLAPEGEILVGYQFGDHLKVHLGISAVYLRNDVLRPGTQIDRTVVFPTSGFKPPLFAFHNQDFFAQGFTAGVEFSF